MKELIWFNVSVLYSTICAGWSVGSSGAMRGVLVGMAVHGGLWSIYRALALIHVEREQPDASPARELLVELDEGDK